VGIHITSLVVQERQADEDVPIIGLFWAIAGEDIIIISLPFGDLLVCQELGRSRGQDGGRLHGACIAALHVSFLNFWFGHLSLYVCLGALGATTVKLKGWMG
jgi:hypothetical protein